MAYIPQGFNPYIQDWYNNFDLGIFFLVRLKKTTQGLKGIFIKKESTLEPISILKPQFREIEYYMATMSCQYGTIKDYWE